MTTADSDGHGSTHAIMLTIPAKAEYITLGRLALTGIARLARSRSRRRRSAT